MSKVVEQNKAELAKQDERKARRKRLTSSEWMAKMRISALRRQGLGEDAVMAQLLADKLGISFDEARKIVLDPEARKLAGLDE